MFLYERRAVPAEGFRELWIREPEPPRVGDDLLEKRRRDTGEVLAAPDGIDGLGPVADVDLGFLVRGSRSSRLVRPASAAFSCCISIF